MRLFNLARGEIKEGDNVHNIKLKLQDDNFHFANYKGKWLVLYFYPMDNTPGCTRQAEGYSLLKPEFEKLNAIVTGVSTGSGKSQENFRRENNLSVSLISDTQGKLAKLFGVKILFGICRRDTVLIDPDGKVEKIFRGVTAANDAGMVLEFISHKNDET